MGALIKDSARHLIMSDNSTSQVTPSGFQGLVPPSRANDSAPARSLKANAGRAFGSPYRHGSRLLIIAAELAVLLLWLVPLLVIVSRPRGQFTVLDSVQRAAPESAEEDRARVAFFIIFYCALLVVVTSSVPFALTAIYYFSDEKNGKVAGRWLDKVVAGKTSEKAWY
ncbi:hypothetical protein BKA67DRAFT_657976 [Truncatella angustata]|uniref:Uncharacterized protein n=1 Tax=Truncatella angustata TaxID=152316 RepID=A0A9P8UQ11_9PEZI|nr:uncharacterized protein BKA67DRAFT_657976 [Truncatella angustata]KAH6656090.1 hypothetical protein BKA67DRAFT_657976 [Truncatella angustata]